MKMWGKELAREASESLGSSGAELEENEALSLLVAAALRKIEANCLEHAEVEHAKAAKAARKMMKAFFPHGDRKEARKEDGAAKEVPIPKKMKPEVTHNASPKIEGLDLGQYANVEMFSADSKKASKFARLMGGMKPGAGEAPSSHCVFALTDEETKKVNREIEGQFSLAMAHKGKKGIGA